MISRALLYQVIVLVILARDLTASCNHTFELHKMTSLSNEFKEAVELYKKNEDDRYLVNLEVKQVLEDILTCAMWSTYAFFGCVFCVTVFVCYKSIRHYMNHSSLNIQLSDKLNDIEVVTKF